MHATINPGAETLRLDKKLLPPLMELHQLGTMSPATSASVGPDLTEADILRAGKLHPLAEAILSIVDEPHLLVRIERTHLGILATSTVWARPCGTVIGSAIGDDVFEFQMASSELLPFHLLQLCRIRPLPDGPRMGAKATISSQTMTAAEEAMAERGVSTLEQALKDHGVAPTDSSFVAEVLGTRVASWRINSLWTGTHGIEARSVAGMDSGPGGHIRISLDEATEPLITMERVEFATTVQDVRSALPT